MRAAYIHIPFCNRICPYCDFNKYVVRGQPVQAYLKALEREIVLTLERDPGQIKSIFVGGGTPTVLTEEELEMFLRSVQMYLQPQENGLEYTFEANPETMNETKTSLLKEYGVNRLSFGVQTFDSHLLKKLGRLHSSDDVYRSIEQARAVGITNISIDLMFGLPDQSLEQLRDTLQTTLDLAVPHVSAYSLKVEEGTFFHTLYQKDKLPLPSEAEEVDMYECIIDTLTKHGYEQYEISNFAQDGYRSTHNLTYWRNEEYYGFGAGAHGYVNGIRHANVAPVQAYIDMLCDQHRLPRVEEHPVSVQEAMEETMMLGLRTKEGVSAAHFYQRFGLQLEEKYGPEIEDLTAKGLIEMYDGYIRLTTKGKFLGNVVFAAFLM